jgi:hypothetical protein
MSFINELPQVSSNLTLTVWIPTSVKPTGLKVIKLGLVNSIVIEVMPEEITGSERYGVTVSISGS